jgi:hypothetical protein
MGINVWLFRPQMVGNTFKQTVEVFPLIEHLIQGFFDLFISQFVLSGKIFIFVFTSEKASDVNLRITLGIISVEWTQWSSFVMVVGQDVRPMIIIR